MPTLSLIAAMDRHRLIGQGNRLPWKLPADLKRFRKLTTGNTVLMGRKTYESIGKALVDRENIVVSRDPLFRPADAKVFTNITTAIEYGNTLNREICVIGGAQIYTQTLALADRFYLSVIPTVFEGDVFFPEFLQMGWKVSAYEAVPSDERNVHPHEYFLLEREKTLEKTIDLRLQKVFGMV